MRVRLVIGKKCANRDLVNNIKEYQVEIDSGKKIMIYTLSTCIWCKKTKILLDELNINYNYVDVDLLDEDLQKGIYEILEKFNKNKTFPTLVLNSGEDVIIGYQPERIKDLV